MTQDQNKPQVTVVIATYNRPQILEVAIKSVRNQTFRHWVLYVIGDNCSQSTQDLMDTIDDERVFYYNSPYRFGEQSGGNSIGVSLAQTKYVAYLNHDDIWTPDHLETAVSALEESGKDFYLGRAIMSRSSENSIPVFKMANAIKRKPSWAFYGTYMLYEPCSSWVLTTKLAKEIGPWKRKIDAGRTPTQEYMMSAWHKKAKFHLGEKITCAYLTHHNNRELHDKVKNTAYAYPGLENQYVYDFFFNRKEEFDRLANSPSLSLHPFKRFAWKVKGSKKRELINRLCLNSLTAGFYYLTGIDCYTGLKKTIKSQEGRIREKLLALQHKTGDTEIKIHDMEEVISYAREHFPKAEKT